MTTLRTALRSLAVALGAAFAAAAAYSGSMNADGISYLDIGDAFWRGDWASAINGVWSPLYAWLLGAAVALADPGPRWEFPLVHLVNFLVYLIALGCFEFFWKEVQQAYGRARGDGLVGLAPALWTVIGYTLFVWSTLGLIEIWAVTPDMGVAACVFLAGGLIVRIYDGRATGRTHLALGAVLGVGYLTKAALFPLGLVIQLVGLLHYVRRDLRRGVARTVVGALTFACIAGPLVGMLSFRAGRPTFSEAGPLTYLKHVQGVPFPHWIPGIVEEATAPTDPPRRVFERPTVWEFATPVAGTYPLSFDPYHWYRGLEVPFDLRRQLTAVAINAGFLLDLLLRRLGGVIAVVLLFGLLGRVTAPGRELIAAAGAAIAMYLLVLMTPRYIAPFMVLLLTGLVARLRLPATANNARLLFAGGVVVVAFLAADFGGEAYGTARGLLGIPATLDVDSASLRPDVRPVHHAGHAAVAEALLASGLERGDPVGFVGYSFDAYWARLARLRIVAEVTPAEAGLFWVIDPERRAAALEAFRGAGALAVVTDRMPAGKPLPGWTPLGATGFHVYRLGDS